MTAAPSPRVHLIERAMGLAPAGLETPPGPVASVSGAVCAAPQSVGSTETLVPSHSATSAEAEPYARQDAASRSDTETPPVTISFDRLRHARLVVLHATAQRHRLSEEIAVAQHQIVRAMRAEAVTTAADGRCSRVIMVTSARPGEGKTFAALNIAASIAAGGTTPVLLVDIDGKHGSISDLLGCADLEGLRALAADPARYPLRIIPTALERLSFLPFGAAPSGVPLIPSSERIAAAVQLLAAALPQHLIILDTPPCLLASEPSVLAPVVGQIVVVVRAEYTQRNEVEAALDMIDACPTLQLLLNQARLGSNDSFGAYGVYGADV